MNPDLNEQAKKARNSVYRLLNFRQRSERELRDKLKKKEIPLKVIDETISYFKKLNLVDDRQFAQAWIAARLAKPLGTNRIRLELKVKGIDEALINEELNSSLSTYNEDQAVEVLAKKQFKTYRSIEKDKAKRRTFGYLMRRGFSHDSIVKAVKTL